MSHHLFNVHEHVFEGQHIREYPRATAHSQEDVLRIQAKQYIPKSNPTPQPGDVTIIGAHANGFPKELYEPLWDDLLAEAETRGFRIRSIWIADVAWQGQSGPLNADLLGNDPSWYDHARDLLQMVNIFRADMPRPLVGVGHSFGGNLLAYLSLLHPRLLTTLVLMDPVFNPGFSNSPLALSSVRRDRWPSREAAVASFRRSPFYTGWDERVLAAWIQYGLQDVPGSSPEVVLATSKHQESFTFMRPLLQGVDLATGRRIFRRDRLPDVTDDFLLQVKENKNNSYIPRQLYRPEVPNTNARLAHLRPGVCFVFGNLSPMSTPELRAEKMQFTGRAVGGSGGVPAGRVHEVVLPRTGHLVAMEEPQVCARAAADWIAQELVLWREEETELVSWWQRSLAEKQVMDEEWRSFIGPTKRPAKL